MHEHAAQAGDSGAVAFHPRRLRSQELDGDLGQRVAEGLAMDVPKAAEPARKVLDLDPSPALSIVRNMKEMLKGRKVGILFSEGSDMGDIEKLKAAIEKAGGTAMLIAPKVGGYKLNGGLLKADGQLAGTPSCVLDAVALVLEESAAKKLCKDGAAVQFVMDAFGHLKAIGASKGAQPLLDKAGVKADDGVTDLGSAFVKAAAKRFFEREPQVRMLA